MKVCKLNFKLGLKLEMGRVWVFPSDMFQVSIPLNGNTATPRAFPTLLLIFLNIITRLIIYQLRDELEFLIRLSYEFRGIASHKTVALRYGTLLVHAVVVFVRGHGKQGLRTNGDYGQRQGHPFLEEDVDRSAEVWLLSRTHCNRFQIRMI